ncbi:MAG: putative Ig domain-containing protein [Planctomycetes bacterium]|nr:putative Ig domain-containing protein [Planctomycetota bacterium]
MNLEIPAVAPTITSTPVTAAFLTQMYTYTVTATGAPAPTFAHTGGTLPAGITFNAGTATFSGTPTATGTFANIEVTATNASGSDVQTFTITVSPSAPEISVDDPGSTTINSGHNFVIYGLFTGTNVIGGTFTINNLGNVDLTISAIASANLVNNTVTITPAQTLPWDIAASGSLDFDFEITVTAVGAFSGRLNIANNDSDENPFFFTWSGTMAATGAPEIAVHTQTGANIPNNGQVNYPNAGTLNFTRTFDIRNEGGAMLTLSGGPVAISNLVNCTVMVTQPANSTLAAAFGDPEIEPFSLSISPVAAGAFSFTVTIGNDDADENPFVFRFNGHTAAFPPAPSKKKKDSGCSTDSSSGMSWMLLAGLAAAMAVAVRTRRQNA